MEIQGTKIVGGIESFTGYPEAQIVDGESSANATSFVLDIITTHGPFSIARSDGGPAFTSREFQNFCKSNNITNEYSDKLDPGGHGKIERFWRTFQDIIRCILPSLNNDLPSAVKWALWAVRSASSSTTKYSPFELVTGRRPRLKHPLELDPFADTIDVKDFAESIVLSLTDANASATTNKLAYASGMQRQLDDRAVASPFKVDDYVGIRRDFNKNFDLSRWDGPFKILELPTKNSAIVALPSGNAKRTFQHLKLFNGTGTLPSLPGPTSEEKKDSAWMEPPPNILPEQLLFKRVKVCWRNNNWLTGTVKYILGNKHYINYDNSDEFVDDASPEGLTLPKKRPKYRVLVSDFHPDFTHAQS